MQRSRPFIISLILGVIAAASAAGWAIGGFADLEESSGNALAAWSSTQWRQTSQADFQAGILDSVDASTTPGDVVLSAGGDAGGANMILFWDGDTPPPGWTVISDDPGEDFYQTFPRGAAAYGGRGGSETHTHAVSSVLESSPLEVTQVRSFTTVAVASANHTHSVASASLSAASNLPSYRSLKVIRYNKGVPAVVPKGAIGIFEGELPPGWERYAVQDGCFVRGDAAAGAIGGSNTHTHSASILLDNCVGEVEVRAGNQAVVASSSHTHLASGTTSSADNRPPFLTVVLGQAETDVLIPFGLIAMFDATPSGNWQVVSGQGEDFYGRFIVGGASYGSTGGSIKHSHSKLALTTGSPSSTVGARTQNANTTVPSSTHSHIVVLSFEAAEHAPPYVDVIFAKALYSETGSVASAVLDTSTIGSRWDAVFWDADLSGGTNITFEARASDNWFTKSDANPAWVDVGDVSPVLSSLPPGRYKQWRATLRAGGGRSTTPILHEVRVYYYRE